MVRVRKRVRVTQAEYDGLLARKKQLERTLQAALKRRTDARQEGVQDGNDHAQAGMEFELTQHLVDEINHQILFTEVIDPQTAFLAADVMSVGRTAKVLRNGNEETITLAETLLPSSPRGTVSLNSPLGKTLNKMREGEERTFQTPGGLSTIKLLTLAS